MNRTAFSAQPPRGQRPGTRSAGLARPVLTASLACLAGSDLLVVLQAFEARDLLAFRAGPVVFKPSFDALTSYGDNVFYLPDESPLEDVGIIKSRDDVTFSISPGISARLGDLGGANNITFNYRFNQILYLENTDRDSGNHNFNLNGGVTGSRLTYTTRNSVALLSSVLTGYEGAIDGIFLPAGNVDRTYYSTAHSFAYSVSTKSRALLDANYGYQDFAGGGLQDIRFLDYQSWTVGGGYDYAITPKVRLGTLVRYGQQEQYSNSDLREDPPGTDTFDASLTASGSFTSKLSGNINIGYQTRDEYGDNLSASVSLNYALAAKTGLALSYSRSGGLGTTTAEGTVTDSVGLNVRQTLGGGRPWFVTAGVRYVHSDYTRSGGLGQEHFDVTASLNRMITTWASAFLSYSYDYGTRSGSDDYQANQVSLGVRIGI